MVGLVGGTFNPLGEEEGKGEGEGEGKGRGKGKDGKIRR